MIDPDRVINGTFGAVFVDGQEAGEFNEMEATLDMEKISLKLCGSRMVKHKRGTEEGKGTLTGFHITSSHIQRGFSRFEIVSKLADPEAYGFERVRLPLCMADSIKLANWKAGEPVPETIAFTFDGEPELLDPIEITE